MHRIIYCSQSVDPVGPDELVAGLDVARSKNREFGTSQRPEVLRFAAAQAFGLKAVLPGISEAQTAASLSACES